MLEMVSASRLPLLLTTFTLLFEQDREPPNDLCKVSYIPPSSPAVGVSRTLFQTIDHLTLLRSRCLSTSLDEKRNNKKKVKKDDLTSRRQLNAQTVTLI